MTNNEAINAWMRGNGWEHRDRNGNNKADMWVKDGFLPVSQDLAAEMWRMSEGRVAEELKAELKSIVALHRDIGDDTPYSIGTGPYIKGRLIKFAHQPKETT